MEAGLIGPFMPERLLMPYMGKGADRAEAFPVEYRMRHGFDAWEQRMLEVQAEREDGERE